MKNVNVVAEENGKLLVEIDTNQDFGLSGSGKSKIIASTEGNKDITLPNGKVVKLGINCFQPVPK